MASQSQLPFVVVWFVFSDVRSIHTQATSCGLQCARCLSMTPNVTVTSFHLRCFHWGRLNMANIIYIELCRQIMLTIFGWNYFWVTKYWIIVLVRLKEIFRFEFDLLVVTSTILDFVPFIQLAVPKLCCSFVRSFRLFLWMHFSPI